MPKIYRNSAAIYAAGISDALACLRSDDLYAANRFDTILDEYDGHHGIMQEVAAAAEIMEQVRVSHGANAKWGGELPYIYDAWDAIAQALWARLGTDPIDKIVKAAIASISVATV